MKYSKPELIIKRDLTDKLNLDEMYIGIGELFTIGIKRNVITGKTKEDCKNKGGKVRMVYGHQEDSEMRVSNVCEFKENGKKTLENIEEDQHGMWVGVPISMIDEVIKQLQELKKVKYNCAKCKKPNKRKRNGSN